MSGSPLITGLTIFFSITTAAVFLYPIIKLTPSWLERRLNGKIAFHRAALEALEAALALPDTDDEQASRLIQQRDFHRAALKSLAAEFPAPTVTGPLPVDLAA
jgi:hypothetical protein